MEVRLRVEHWIHMRKHRKTGKGGGNDDDEEDDKEGQGWGYSSLAQCLSRMLEALGSKPRNA